MTRSNLLKLIGVRGFGNACVAAVVVLAFVVFGVAAQSEPLARLHVSALSLHSDRLRVAVGQTFHVTIHLHVAERIGEPANLFLPDLSNCEINGTERHTTAGPDGTDYVETLTLSAAAPGRAMLSPARLLAVDARTGKPSQFASNALTIAVGSADVTTSQPVREMLRLGRDLVLWSFIALMAIVALILGSRLAYRRLQRSTPSAPPRAPDKVSAPRIVPSRAQALRDALRALDGERTPAAALRVRALLFELAGAPSTGTLRDVLATLDGTKPALRATLRAAEVAAFGDAPQRTNAFDETLRTGDALVRELEGAG